MRRLSRSHRVHLGQILLSLLCFSIAVAAQSADKRDVPAIDNHVHILSPALIKIWKGLGIPFSRPDTYYSEIDEIVENVGARGLVIVSMAHVFSSEEFGKFENERELVQAENDFVAAARDKHRGRARAICSVDPLRDYALSELERCRAKLKFDGIKLHHNASQVYLTEPEHLRKVRAIFEFAAKNRMPVLLHFDNGHRRFGAADVNLLIGSVLKGLPPVSLTIAHFGTSGGFNTRTKAVIDAFREQFRTNKDVRRHRITFDISAVALDKDSEGVRKLTDNEFTELAIYVRRLGMDRIRFATDYPLYTAAEYLEILRNQLGLTDAEIDLLLKEKK